MAQHGRQYCRMCVLGPFQRFQQNNTSHHPHSSSVQYHLHHPFPPPCKLCCCNAGDLLSVYDPDLNKRFIMVDDELVEDPEDDIETGEQQTEHVMGSACNGELTEMTNMIWSEGRVVQNGF